LIDNKIKGNNEYQLTDALENMKNGSVKFRTETVDEWLDCGNKDATVYTNQRIIHHLGHRVSEGSTSENSVIIEPCYIDDKVSIRNSVIGPYVSIGKETKIENSIIKNSIIQTESKIINANISNSMIGNSVKIERKPGEYSIGDYNTHNQ
jgi:glucose-1-phosphate thymidylyltransferase